MVPMSAFSYPDHQPEVSWFFLFHFCLYMYSLKIYLGGREGVDWH